MRMTQPSSSNTDFAAEDPPGYASMSNFSGLNRQGSKPRIGGKRIPSSTDR